MKKTTLLLSLAALSISTVISASPLTKGELNKLYESYPKVLNKNFIKIIGSDKHKGFTQLKIRTIKGRSQTANMFLVDNIKDVVFFGAAIDNKTGKPYEIPANKDVIKKGVAFTYGDGKTELYVFSDPECPFCQQLEQKIDLKKYKIHYIPIPLSMHRNTKNVLKWVLSAKTPKEQGERLHSYMSGKDKDSWKGKTYTKEQEKTFNDYLSKADAAAQEISLKGTPTVYGSDFKPVNIGDILK